MITRVFPQKADIELSHPVPYGTGISRYGDNL